MTRILSPSTPRTLPQTARGPGVAAARAFALLFAAAGLSAPLSAAVAVPYTASLNITDDSGNLVSLVDFSSILSYDASTGDLSMPVWKSPLPTGWSWTTVNTLDPATGALQAEHGVTTQGVSFYATGSTDPFLSYGFSVKNTTGSVQNYTFTYGESIVPPVSGSYNLYADIAGTVTNNVSGTAAKVVPTTPDQDGDGIPEIQALKFSTDGGATLFDAGADVGPAFTTGTAAHTYAYPLDSTTTSGSLGAAVNYWQFQSKFSLTPGGDVASFAGFAELDQVIPEPATYAALLGAMALGVAALRRRNVNV